MWLLPAARRVLTSCLLAPCCLGLAHNLAYASTAGLTCSGLQVIDEFGEKTHLVEIDIQKDAEIAQAGGVGGTPTVQFFKTKERLHHLPGVKQKSE